jgi:hypothetical protein
LQQHSEHPPHTRVRLKHIRCTITAPNQSVQQPHSLKLLISLALSLDR